MENIQPLIDALGGGLAGVVILGLWYDGRQERQRNNDLADKIIISASDTQRVMVDLAHKIDAALGGRK